MMHAYWIKLYISWKKYINTDPNILIGSVSTNMVGFSAVVDTTMYRHRDLTIRVLIQLALYRYCGTCAAVDRA